jgi:hypothetical protein
MNPVHGNNIYFYFRPLHLLFLPELDGGEVIGKSGAQCRALPDNIDAVLRT